MDELITSSLKLISIDGETRDKTGQMHPPMKAFIHG